MKHLNPFQRIGNRLAIRVISAVFLISCTGFNTSALAQQNLSIAATVNDEMISALDLQSRITLVAAFSGFKNTPETQQRLAPQVMQTLIEERIRMQEAKRLEITAEKNELEAEKSDVERQIKIKPGQLIPSLEANGIDPETLLDQLEAKIVWTKIIRSKFSASVQISDEEIDEIIEEIKANKGLPEFLVSEIYLPAETPDQVREAMELATRLLEQIQSGANFAAVAQNFSQSTSAQSGGNLGWNRESQLNAEIRPIVLGLEPNQISRPVHTSDGVYLIQLAGKRISRGLEGPPPEPAKVTLHQLHLATPPETSAAQLEALKQKAEGISASATDCQAFDAMTKQYGSPLSGPLGTFAINEISQKMQDLVSNLPVGKPSPAQATGDGVMVLMVCDREVAEAKPIDLEDLRSNIRRALTSERLLLASRRYLRDLRRAAFIDIRL